MFFLKKIVHIFYWFLGKTFFSFFFRFEIKGQEHLKGLQGPLIVSFNHTSWLDPLFVGASFPPRCKAAPIHFAMWRKYYLIFLPLSVMAGAFPVERGMGLEKTLAKGLSILKKRGVVGIAPEGRRRRFGRPRRGRRGVAFLACQTNAPILPIYIEGALGLTMSEVFFRKNKVIVKIGKPFRLPVQSIKEQPDLIRFSNLVMDRIYQLKNAK